jgi:catechol 2,3-dioxygenase-like lactoylglutathione lyase family enzyme
MSETMPGLIGRAFDQLCFVVEDLDAAIGYWRRVNGVERWSKAYDLAKDQIDKEYWGEPGDFQFSCAYAFAGNLLIELAEHDGGRSVYKDWLETRGPSQHHIGFRLTDAAEYEAAVWHYLGRGLKKAMSGWFKGDDSNCKWAYFDTVRELGCYTELYYVDGSALAAWEAFRDGASDELIPSMPRERRKIPEVDAAGRTQSPGHASG